MYPKASSHVLMCEQIPAYQLASSLQNPTSIRFKNFTGEGLALVEETEFVTYLRQLERILLGWGRAL